ncbi:MAG: HAD family phosphatase [Leptolyngbyaceae cyanobacterium MO_188.B28]|nr:HAD family phosphatase [Leptolyngbyaceae cyanobacterium MO_188.B28]
MLQAVLFDLDGTLANTDPIHFLIWQRLLQKYGLEIDVPFYRQHISGRLNDDILQDLLPQLSSEEGKQFCLDKEARFRDMAQGQLQTLPGLLPLIDWLKQQGMQSAVVTNAPRPNTEFMLKTLKLDQTFDIVIISGDLPIGKPNPLPYQEALRRLDLAPEQSVVFEDSPSGIRAAVAAGITTVGIASSHPPKSLYELGAKLVIDDFTDDRLTHLGLMI